MIQFRNPITLCLIAALFIPFNLVSASQTTGNARISLPAPTGALAVGRESFHWTDHSRKELLTAASDDDRELMVHIWYPAEPASGMTASPYIPDLELLKAGLDDSQYAILSKVQTHTFAHAKSLDASSRYPVLFFSHGNQMSSFLYTALIEDLVSNGYIVASIDHPYEALFTVFPDRRVIGYSEDRRSLADRSSDGDALMRYLRQRIEERAADINFVITQLASLDINQSRFKGRLDLNHIGVIGHSNGGTAAVQACHANKRIKAVINLDGRAAAGPFYPDSSGRGPEQPFMYVAKPLRDLTGKELEQQRITRQQFEKARAQTIARDDELMRSVKSGSYRVTINGATHESFSDEPLLSPATDAEAAQKLKLVKMVRAYVLAFLDCYLRDKTSKSLDSLNKLYSEVTVDRFGAALK
jgi:predicted dienelactone hydrolase